MGSFNKKVLQDSSSRLLDRFSLPTQSLVQDAKRNAWTQFVMHETRVHIKADLTLKQSRVVQSPPIWGQEDYERRVFITEDIAYANIEQFAPRCLPHGSLH